MSNIINFQDVVERKRQKLILECKQLREENTSLLKEIIIPNTPNYVNAHPIPNLHWSAGRILYSNCEADKVTEVLFKARGHGYSDLVVEKTAFDFIGERAFIPKRGYVAIYGKSPRKIV